MDITEDQIYALAPFAATLGIRFPTLTPDRVQAVLPTTHELSTLGGGLHGGAVMSVCDVASAVCVALNVDGNRHLDATEDRQTLATVRTEVHDDAHELCAHTTQMVHISRPAG